MEIEICCGSVDDALAAAQGGAQRIELNSALFLGGLTPSVGCIIETKKQTTIPTMVMIRPRSGGFCYTDSEIAVMERDIAAARDHGAEGVVFGVLDAAGTVNAQRCERLLRACAGLETVFHRAIDVVPNVLVALDRLIDLGFDRVLTSGQAPRAVDGAATIAAMIQHAAGRIAILPGGGIRPSNLAALVHATGCTGVHIAVHRSLDDESCNQNPAIHFGGALYPSENQYAVADETAVAQAVAVGQAAATGAAT